jgi:hypothetical protein
MKKLVFLMVFMLSALGINAKEYQIESITSRVFANGSWTDWLGWEESSLILNMDKTHIKINSDTPQSYTIITDTYDKKRYSDGYIYESWTAKDKQSRRLKITLISKDGYLYYISIAYHDAEWVYKISL